MAVIRKHKILAFGLALCMGVLWFSLVDTSHGAQVTSRSDTLSNAGISATSNHAVTFTVQDNVTSQACAIPPCPGSTSSTLSITFPSDFSLSTLTCNDLDIATGTQFLLNVSSGDTRTNCPNTGTSWGALIDSANRVLTFTSPTSVAQYTPVVTGTTITIKIGSNAASQGTGTHWITNASAGGAKTITVGGSFGGTGNMLVAINQAVQLSATIVETLTFAINGLPGVRFGGTDPMTGCSGINFYDEDDGNGLTGLVTTTAVTVPFGTLMPNNYYEGCQRLEIQTNAGSGYTITSRENHPLQTVGGFIIDDTVGDTGLATPTTANDFILSDGLGISCRNSATSASCSTANPNWINGAKWAPISAGSKALSPAKFSGLTTATSALVLAKVKYRLTAWDESAGTYTNLVSFIATPVY